MLQNVAVLVALSFSGYTHALKQVVPKPTAAPAVHAVAPPPAGQADVGAARRAEPPSECGHPASDRASEEEGEHNREAVERGEPEPCPPEAPHRTLEELQATQEAELENRRIEAREEACLASSGVRGC